MLRKLLKYDLKWTFKFLSIFYALALIFALLTRIFLRIDNSLIMEIIGQICSGATISMIFSIIMNNSLRLWMKFKQNLYGDESYLTHTLPAQKKTLYLSKILNAIISLFASILFIAVMIYIAYYSKENFDFLKSFLQPLLNAFDVSLLGLLLILLFILFLEFINILQCGFAGIIIGHRFASYKSGLSVLFGFISFTVSQLFVLAVFFIFALFNSELMNLFFTNHTVSFAVLKSTFFICMAIYCVVAIIGFAINVKLLNKGVNVD